MQPCVLSLIDHAHPAATEFLDNAVVRDGLVNHYVDPSFLVASSYGRGAGQSMKTVLARSRRRALTLRFKTRRITSGWSANRKLCGHCRKITFTLTTPSLESIMPADPCALESPEWVTQELLDDAKRRSPNTRHWVPAYNMATEYYDHGGRSSKWKGIPSDRRL